MIRKIGKGLIVATGAVGALAGQASATGLVDVSTLAVDTSMLGTVGGVVLIGLASIWGFRKVVKSINRS